MEQESEGDESSSCMSYECSKFCVFHSVPFGGFTGLKATDFPREPLRLIGLSMIAGPWGPAIERWVSEFFVLEVVLGDRRKAAGENALSEEVVVGFVDCPDDNSGCDGCAERAPPVDLA